MCLECVVVTSLLCRIKLNRNKTLTAMGKKDTKPSKAEAEKPQDSKAEATAPAAEGKGKKGK